jgi:5-methylcytosine-specific restriction endonuclease McrA
LGDRSTVRFSNRRSLVLNASFEPLGVSSARRALILVLNHRAVVAEKSEVVIHHQSGSFTLPSVIRLQRFVKVKFRRSVPLSRRSVFARDGGRCVYCNNYATTIDHVIPKSKGGQHSWENVVSSCHDCNHTKDDFSLNQLGWRLEPMPFEPRGHFWSILGHEKPDPVWEVYLSNFGYLPQNLDKVVRLVRSS